jgi:hypothetical protein
VEILDLKKVIVLFALLCVVAPAVGVLIRKSQLGQKIVFFLMCFLMIGGFFGAQEWGLTIHSMLYRGTARGFHFYWADVAAVCLIFASMAGNWRRFRFLPPGLWLYLLYCVAAFISIANAPHPIYTWFAFVKALKLSLIFVAAYNFIKTEEDLRFALGCLACVMLWELVAVLDQKYVKHIYQVWGTFEHQNSLCMFTVLAGMVFLAAALGPKTKMSNYFLAAYIACGVVVQSTLSRAGLAIFAAGTMLVVFLSFLDRATKRRFAVLGALGCVGLIGLAMTMDTIIKRFSDYGNEESANTRKMLNISSRMMLTEYPIGIGWNNFAHVINKPYVESLWWLLLAETGYQGLVTFLFVVILFLWWNFRNMLYYRHRTLGAISIGLFAGSLMNYTQSFVERVLIQPRNAMLWLILLAVTARITTWRKREVRLRRIYWRMFREEATRRRFKALPEKSLAA